MNSKSKPLSASKYIMNNRKKISLVTIIAVLGVVLLFSSKGIIESISNNVVKAWAAPFKNLTIVVPGTENTNSEDIAVEKIYITGATGRISTFAFFTTEKGVEKILELSGAELIEGRLPESGTNEILIHEDISKNQDWKIGTVIGTHINENDSLGGEFVITGIINGEGIQSIGSLSGIEKINDKITTGKLIPEKNYATNAKENLVYTYDKEMDDIINYGSTLSASMVVLLVIITAVSAISISFLLYLFYLQRSPEFGILMAMGYSKNFIVKRSMVEILFILLLSLILGIIGGLIILLILDSSIFSPMGQGLTIFDMSYLTEVIMMIVFIYIISNIPIIKMINRIDPISVIEGGVN